MNAVVTDKNYTAHLQNLKKQADSGIIQYAFYACFFSVTCC